MPDNTAHVNNSDTAQRPILFTARHSVPAAASHIHMLPQSEIYSSIGHLLVLRQFTTSTCQPLWFVVISTYGHGFTQAVWPVAMLMLIVTVIVIFNVRWIVQGSAHSYCRMYDVRGYDPRKPVSVSRC